MISGCAGLIQPRSGACRDRTNQLRALLLYIRSAAAETTQAHAATQWLTSAADLILRTNKRSRGTEHLVFLHFCKTEKPPQSCLLQQDRRLGGNVILNVRDSLVVGGKRDLAGVRLARSIADCKANLRL